jgi:hypothetical protein
MGATGVRKCEMDACNILVGNRKKLFTLQDYTNVDIFKNRMCADWIQLAQDMVHW